MGSSIGGVPFDYVPGVAYFDTPSTRQALEEPFCNMQICGLVGQLPSAPLARNHPLYK